MRRSLRLGVGCSLVVASVVLLQLPASAQPPVPFQSGPPPVINMSEVPNADLSAVQAFESSAVSQVLATHDLPSSDASAVLGWGRNDVRAQEWLNLANIIQEPASSRSASDQDVYDWFQGAYAAELVSEAQDAVKEYQLWSGEPIGSSVGPVGFGDPVTTTLRGSNQSIQTGYCNFAVPGGTSGPFANSYSGNDDPTCYPPYTCPGGLPVCTVSYPTLQQFQNWGAYDAVNKEISAPDFSTNVLGAASAIGVGATLAVAGITTALSASFGGAGIASSVSSAIFPFAARVFYEFGAGVVDAASAAADAAAASAALTAGAIAFVVGIVLFFAVSTALAIVQIVQDDAIAGQLQTALSDAQQDSTPDLVSVEATTSGYATLFALFIAQSEPDVDYDCTAASSDPCADAPTPPGESTSDPQFLVTTTTKGVATTVASPTIYSADPQTQTYNQTYLSGNGWFVSTKYPEGSSTEGGPSGTPGATFESLQFPYTDWSGNHWIAERFVDASGNPEFAVTPLDSSTSTDCTNPTVAVSTTGKAGCVTNQLDVTEPNGTEETVQVVPASTVVPTLAATVPANTTIGVATPIQATATDPNGLALSYSWLIECPGTYVGTVDGHTGYAGTPCDLLGSGDDTLATTLSGADTSFTFNDPGLYPVTVTATDSAGYKAVREFQVESTGVTTTTLAADWPDMPADPTYGEPVTYTATVTTQNCLCYSGFGGTLFPGGSVQFDVDGLPYGAPVQLTQNGSEGIASLAIPDLSVAPATPHAVTAQFLPGVEYFPGKPPVPIIAAAQGFESSSSTATSTSVDEGSTTLGLSTSWSTQPSALAYGQPLQVTATVSPTGQSSLPPTGAVQFTVNGSPEGAPVQLGGQGQASTSLTDLPVTPPCSPYTVCFGNSIGATYVGDAGYQASTGSTNGLFVTPDETSMVGAGASPTTVVSGQAVELGAVVVVDGPGQATATGNFTFTDGSTTLGTVPIQQTIVIPTGPTTTVTWYVATLTTSLGAGTHAIAATYDGDAHTAPSSTGFSLDVGKDASTASVATSATVVAGGTYHVTARVRAVAPGAGVPTGAVTFYDGTSPIAGCVGVTLTSAATAACTATAPATEGVQHLTARYAGDANFTAVTTGTATIRVLYGFGHFWRPLLENNVLVEGEAIPVSFLLTNADGSFVADARAAALAAAGGVDVVFSGPGISPITTPCTWISLPPRHLSCDFTPPAGLPPSKWYTVTAYETVAGKTYRIPIVLPSTYNPVRIHF